MATNMGQEIPKELLGSFGPNWKLRLFIIQKVQIKFGFALLSHEAIVPKQLNVTT